MGLKANNPGCGCCTPPIDCEDCCTDSLPSTVEVAIPAALFSANGCTTAGCTALNGTTVVLNAVTPWSLVCSVDLITGNALDSGGSTTCAWRKSYTAGPLFQQVTVTVEVVLVTSGSQCRLRLRITIDCDNIPDPAMGLLYGSASFSPGTCLASVRTLSLLGQCTFSSANNACAYDSSKTLTLTGI